MKLKKKISIYKREYRKSYSFGLHDDFLLVAALIHIGFPKDVDIIEYFLEKFNEPAVIKRYLNDIGLKFYYSLLKSNYFELMELLFQYGLNINNNEDTQKEYNSKFAIYNYKPFYKDEYNHNIEIFSKYKKENAKTFLMFAAGVCIHNPEVVRFLLKNNADKNMIDENKYIALHYACQNNNFEVINELITEKNINLKDVNGNTALMTAIKNGYYECGKIILSNELNIIDVNILDNDNFSVIGFMIKNSIDNEEIYNLLFEKRAYIDIKYLTTDDYIKKIEDNNGLIKSMAHHSIISINCNEIENIPSPVVYFMKNNRIDLVEKLLKNNANVNDKDIEGNTLLFYACKNGKYRFMKKLLNNYHDDPTIKNNKGETVLNYAMNKEKPNNEIISNLE